MLPGMSGLDVLRRLRSSSRIPIIILTARGDEIDRVLGLEIGADDYLAKPFSPRELIARLRAVLRRSLAPGASADTIEVAGFSLNSAAREACLDGAKLDLTGVEFSLLEVLLQNAGRVVRRQPSISYNALAWAAAPVAAAHAPQQLSAGRIRHRADRAGRRGRSHRPPRRDLPEAVRTRPH